MPEQERQAEQLQFLRIDEQYKDLVKQILAFGVEKSDPQGVGNISMPGMTLKFDLSDGNFPLLTLRDLSGSWKAMVNELLWFIEGSTNTADLHKNGVHFWDQWAEATAKDFDYPPGELGPIYGKQWRAFDGGGDKPVDQLREAMRLLKGNPDSRRIVVSAWNPVDTERVFIAPCISYFQFHHARGRLSLSVVQRSGDVPVGVPFDVAEYSLLLLMAAKVHNMQPSMHTHFIADAHIYQDQIEPMEELVTREPKSEPRVVIKSAPSDIFGFKAEDFELTGYEPHPKMRIKVAL